MKIQYPSAESLLHLNNDLCPETGNGKKWHPEIDS